MRQLHLLFKNADGSRKRIVVEHCHQDLSPETVRQAMEAISALGLFERAGVQLYTEIIGAKYVEKKITVLFDDAEPTLTPKPAVTEHLVPDVEDLKATANAGVVSELESQLPELALLLQLVLLFLWANSRGFHFYRSQQGLFGRGFLEQLIRKKWVLSG